MDEDEGGPHDDCADGTGPPEKRRDADDQPESAADGSDASDEGFHLGAALEALSHSARRKALAHLATCESPVDVEELAGELEGPYTVRDPLNRSMDREHHVKMELYHVHLPKLDEAGLVAFDPAERTVSITEAGEEAMDRLF